uniref:Uncharacterized protein n=1 Tax=Lepeophtheirus salmonis TaxID=72036 RepID=A0A0K2T5M3_LEPSM
MQRSVLGSGISSSGFKGKYTEKLELVDMLGLDENASCGLVGFPPSDGEFLLFNMFSLELRTLLSPTPVGSIDPSPSIKKS